MHPQLRTDDEAIWTTQAYLGDPAAMEALLMPLPAAVAEQARRLAKLPGQNGMEYDERLQCAYWFTHTPARVFVCVTFSYVPSLDAAEQLWSVLSDVHSEPSVERLFSAYREATGVEIDALPLQ